MTIRLLPWYSFLSEKDETPKDSQFLHYRQSFACGYIRPQSALPITVIEPSSYKGAGVSTHENFSVPQRGSRIERYIKYFRLRGTVAFRRHQPSHIENVIIHWCSCALCGILTSQVTSHLPNSTTISSRDQVILDTLESSI